MSYTVQLSANERHFGILRSIACASEEAATSLIGPQALAQEDADSEDKASRVFIGMGASARRLAFVYLLRDETRIRLISARKATREEAGHYA